MLLIEVSAFPCCPVPNFHHFDNDVIALPAPLPQLQGDRTESAGGGVELGTEQGPDRVGRAREEPGQEQGGGWGEVETRQGQPGYQSGMRGAGGQGRAGGEQGRNRGRDYLGTKGGVRGWVSQGTADRVSWGLRLVRVSQGAGTQPDW